MEPIIRLQDVQFEYLSFEGEEIAALNGVTLDIQKGEFVVIIGHNGSGKSTLAKHLNALLRPSSGVVWIKGMDTRDEDKLWEIRQTAGMVFQNPDNQLVATVVEEDVAFGPENLGLPPEEIQRRVAEALKAVGMQEYAQAAPHYLSGGQKQRVAIAGILAMKPEIIVLDEPTAMLDPVGRREVMETVKYLNKHEGITVVHITHYMEEAVDADRVIVMEQGKIVLQGTPQEVFSQVEVLKEIGLDVPQVTELAYRLRAEGLDVPLNVLKVEEMVDAICRL
ncbi:MAG: energy-coupling factor transporter ATPase [Caldicoprobacter oshimai]|uniref:ABC transporter ATP-binding protein n=1 Tax=Caldicoprobacter faecalis TaxID=937334 RepID=A0A1I5TXE1_9FIRM|nr:energy-coupling factor transporter ATPase [Caldicoprobacter faecalis]PZN09380.1 MAG: energy-coupling factor transporter ATPase [Caldicoprobacter oshimai]SFP87561.1 energy-coupling factor transport system ATP-binding protein [Caldicoprobacter faecalis]